MQPAPAARPSPLPRLLAALTACAGLVLGLAGCSTADTTTSTGADLTFSSMTWSPGSPEVGSATTVTVVVYNAGTIASTVTTYNYTFQGDTSIGALPAIASGGSTTLTFSVQSSVYGASAVAVVLDPSGYVTETDETNNTRTRTITWTQDPIGDLSITALTTASSTVTPGGTASITPTIAFNATTTSSSQTVTWRVVRSDSTSTALNSGSVSVAADGTLSPTLTFSDANGSGSTSYRLVIDYNDTIPESDETNNYWTFTIDWSASG